MVNSVKKNALSDRNVQLGPDLSFRLTDVTRLVGLTTEQVARLCGVSRRQLSYWVQRGLIKGDDGYSHDTVEKVLLVKRGLDAGSSLRVATSAAEQRLAQRQRLDETYRRMTDDEIRGRFVGWLDQLIGQLGELAMAARSANDPRLALRIRKWITHVRQADWLAAEALAIPVTDQVEGLARALTEAAALLAAANGQPEVTPNEAGARATDEPDPAPERAFASAYISGADEEEIVRRLELNATDAAAFCRVTVRQLTYWTDRGLITASPNSSRIYGIDALRKALLVYEVLRSGQSLEKAVASAELRLAERESAEARAASQPVEEWRLELGEMLGSLRDEVVALRANVELRLALVGLKVVLATINDEGIETRLRRPVGGAESAAAQATAFVTSVDRAAELLRGAVAVIVAASPAASGD